MIEALLAITVLLTLFFAWGLAMIVATDAENKAGNHTQAISTANEILEYMRRDPNFWSPTNQGGEYNSGSCPHCWAAYNDTIGKAARSCSTVSPITWSAPTCTFNWLAVQDPSPLFGASTLADLTVVVYFVGNNHQTETYTVMGMVRQK